MQRKWWILLGLAFTCVAGGGFGVGRLFTGNEAQAIPALQPSAQKRVKRSTCGQPVEDTLRDGDYRAKRAGYDTYELFIGGKEKWWPMRGAIRIFREEEAGRSLKGTYEPFEYTKEGEDTEPYMLPYADWLACEHAAGRTPLVTHYWFQALKNTPVALAWTIETRHANDAGEKPRVIGGGNLRGKDCPEPTAYKLLRHDQLNRNKVEVSLKPIQVDTKGLNSCRSADEKTCAAGRTICLLHVADTPMPCPEDKLQRQADGCSRRRVAYRLHSELAPDGEWMLEEEQAP